MIRKIGIGIVGLIAVAMLSLGAIYIFTMPESLPDDSESQKWLQPGPYSVGSLETVFIDNSRATAENRGAAGTPERTFPTTIWYPENSSEALPLILHSHGFTSSRSDLSYAAEHLASYGYVFAAADYPLTSGSAPGGPNANDLLNQPADVSFLIDSVLALSTDNKPFDGEIDTSRIGLTGYSLGGLTTSIATYHPRLRDPRISAAASIAGLSVGFVESFYRSTDIPFLMIAGTLDALVDFQANAAVIPKRVRNSALVSIEGGTHLGFSSLADPLFRLMHHPDGLGCAAVLSNIDGDANDAYIPLGSERDGIVLDSSIPTVCETMPTEKALHPGRQHMVTQIALLAFFESVFSTDELIRQQAKQQLQHSLSAEMPEASYTEQI